MQKNSIELLQCHRQTLEQELGFFSSPDTLLILWPRAEIKSEGNKLNVFRFSTAIGWKIRLVGKLLYSISFRSAANSATIPSPVAAVLTYDCASVLTTVTSQASDVPPCHAGNSTAIFTKLYQQVARVPGRK